MPRPFHRSFTLWLGLAGLVFLFWAWADSRRMQSVVVAGVPPRIALLHVGSSLRLTFLPSLGYGKFFAFGGSEHRPIPSRLQTEPLFPRLEGRWNIWPGGHHDVILPHWFLILLYLSLWSLAFTYRHRRLKRSLTEPPSSVPRRSRSPV